MRFRAQHLASAALIALLCANGAAAQTPLGTGFTYQGNLRQGGVPASGPFDLVFRLYDDPATSLVLSEDLHCGVQVADGRFTIELDFGAVFDGQQRWLETDVTSAGPCDETTTFTTLTPRQPLTATPNAHYAGNSGMLGGLPVDAFLKAGEPIPGNLVVGNLELGAGGGILFSDGTVQTTASAIDPSGNIVLNGRWLSGDGDDEGVTVDAAGDVRFGDLVTRTEVGFGWDISTVDDDGDVGTHTSTFVLDDGTVFVSYYDVDMREIKLARSGDDGQSWNVTRPTRLITVSEESSVFAIDRDTVFVAYYREGQAARLELARSNDGGVSWMAHVVDSDFGSVQPLTMAALDADVIFIAYGVRKLASSGNGGTSWRISPIDATGFGVANSMIVLDVNTILISSDGAGAQFARTNNGGLSWSSVEITSASVAGDVSLAMTDNGDLYVAYYRVSSRDLWLARSTDDGVSWASSLIDTNGDVGRFSSLAVVGAEQLFVAYHDESGDDLEFARSDDGGNNWELSTIESDFRVGEWSSLAALSLDAVYVGYYHRQFRRLNVASSRLAKRSMGIGTDMPVSDLQVKGYLQVGLTGGRPPQFDCDEREELGRIKMDGAGGLYLCTQSGWLLK